MGDLDEFAPAPGRLHLIFSRARRVAVSQDNGVRRSGIGERNCLHAGSLECAQQAFQISCFETKAQSRSVVSCPRYARREYR